MQTTDHVCACVSEKENACRNIARYSYALFNQTDIELASLDA